VFDSWDPANVSPVAAYLASDLCPITGKVFFVQGGRVQYFQPWTLATEIDKGERWTIDELAVEMPRIVGHVSSPAGRRHEVAPQPRRKGRSLFGDLRTRAASS